LQQKNGSLRGSSPNELAPFALTVLDVDIATRIFQAAIFENAVDEDPIVQNEVLTFKRLAFVSVHSSNRQKASVATRSVAACSRPYYASFSPQRFRVPPNPPQSIISARRLQ
jgi:hypothetical protein